MLKSLVTGANGFVGSAVARCLLNAGHEVRCLVRPGSDRRNLYQLPVEISEGDLRSAPSLKRAVAGCDNLFHVAADYRLWVPNPETMYDINVKGTQALILAAAEAGMRRMVYTSSVATLGTSQQWQTLSRWARRQRHRILNLSLPCRDAAHVWQHLCKQPRFGGYRSHAVC